MAANQNTQAVQAANQIIALSQTVLSIYQQMVVLDQAWNDNSVATVLAAMQTTTVNADSVPGVADGAPNVAHPIDTSKYGLSRAVSSNQIAQAKTIMDGLVSYVGGQAVATQVGAHAILNAVTGG